MMALTIDCSGVFRGYLLNPVDNSNNQISSLMHPGTNVGMGYQEDHSQNVCSFASWFQVKRLIRMLTSISNNLNNGDLYTVM